MTETPDPAPTVDIDQIALGRYPNAPNRQSLEDWAERVDASITTESLYSWVLGNCAGSYRTSMGALYLLHHAVMWKAIYEREKAPTPEERPVDLYCSRCGHVVPDPDEAEAGRNVNKSYHAMALRLAEHARRRFESIGEIRRMRGLSHPRVQRVRGHSLEPGWLLSEDRKEGVFGRGHRWSAIVTIDEGCGMSALTEAHTGGMRTMTLDPHDGQGLASRAFEPNRYYFVETFSVEPARLEDGAA